MIKVYQMKMAILEEKGIPWPPFTWRKDLLGRKEELLSILSILHIPTAKRSIISTQNKRV